MGAARAVEPPSGLLRCAPPADTRAAIRGVAEGVGTKGVPADFNGLWRVERRAGGLKENKKTVSDQNRNGEFAWRAMQPVI
jgi:hypothetical protein